MLLELLPALRAPGTPVPFDFTQDWPDLMDDDAQIVFHAPVQVSGAVAAMDEDFLLRGDIAIAYTTQCARCLAPIQTQLNLPFSEVYVRDGSDVTDDEHAQRYTFTGDTIVLDEMVREYILLNMPLKHLCHEDCPGLCPQCGVDLNQGPCPCPADV